MKIITTAEGGVEIDFEASGGRRCGGCTLCCKLLPNVALDKRAGHRCVHQRHGKGCAIYPKRPTECQVWSCRWLAAEDETHGMHRPDRSHYVIDALPDTIRVVPHDGGETREFDAAQIWIDPAFPEAAHDPQLRAYMLKMAQEHAMPSLLRWSNRVATAVFPPPLNNDGEWHEVTSECGEGFGLFSKLPKQFQNSLAKSLMLALALATATPAIAAESGRPYSCQLFDAEQRKCAFGPCDKRTVERLRNECLRDGGRP